VGARDPRDQLADVGREVSRAGLVVASGGNISTREPGSDQFWVTAAGTYLDRLDRDDFVPVLIAGSGSLRGASRREDMPSVPPRASTESALHAATYAVRPDVNAVIHLHPQIVVLLDALGESIRLITTDHAFYVGRVATTPFHPPGSAELAEVAAEAVHDGTNCVVLAHHGCSVVGDTLESALRRAVNLEEAARLTYRALLLTGGIGPRPVRECPPIGAA
jgi:ribulose-5-phosphate 4-epimerase/fuculose-1-phosphate aldolase